MDNLDFSPLWQFRDALMKGLLISLELSVICAVLGTAFGFFIAIGRQSHIRPLRAVMGLYVEVLRGTPVLVTLFWVFFCLPIILRFELGTFESSVIAMTLYMAAVTSESCRRLQCAWSRAVGAIGLRHRAPGVDSRHPQSAVQHCESVQGERTGFRGRSG
jgi:His/Glu/Gln/Arg/opine family amino acid ABC transporter permease subunit